MEVSTSDMFSNTGNTTSTESIIDVQPTEDISTWYPWVLATVYIIMGGGVFLNFITVVALMKSSLLSSGKPVHQFIFNMAMSDLLACLVSQPFLMFQYAEAGARYIMNRKMACMGSLVGLNIGFDSTVTALFLITCERLFAIISPLQHMHRVTRRACRVVTWLLVTAKSAVLLFWNSWNPRAPCVIIVILPEQYGYYIYNPNLYISMGLIILLNFILGVAVIIAKRKAKTMHASQTLMKSSKSELKIVKIVFFAVAVLVVTWIPNNTLGTLIFGYIQKGQATPFELLVALHMTRGMTLIGTVADPLIYFLQNNQCRDAVLGLFGRTGTPEIKQSIYAIDMKNSKSQISEYVVAFLVSPPCLILSHSYLRCAFT
ncbi:hypothetical protein CAPTEDRAFT_196514 [Capitella teleta]|uniref:G-protein coupled receptors family 1 profile domain-containing protein n=1 Tax=Capitella teleta TaxID=283909 RepID=R7V4B9_CAPTE|nr:hypothetical protein CAPTEDRAFT_196514 [Capitella teleta]|eukprot:ELU13424.1 hypothetical protein CAPTEDRAFT_196514 [Capitella teleta]